MEAEPRELGAVALRILSGKSEHEAQQTFCRMEPTGSLQVQILAESAEVVPMETRPDVAGFEMKSTCEVTMLPGQVAYANLGMAFCPPIGSELLLLPIRHMEGKPWKVDGSRVASDITGEAMIALRNIGLSTVILPKGTVLARMLIEDRRGRPRIADGNDRNKPQDALPKGGISDFATAKWRGGKYAESIQSNSPLF